MRGIIGTLLIFVGLVVLFDACSAVGSNESGGGSGLAQPDGPHFTHAAHIDRDLECSDCHGEEEEGWKAMPDLEFCMECHEDIDEEKPEGERVATMFFDEEGKGRWIGASKLDPELIFDHASHLKNNDDCLRCHGDVVESDAIPASAAFTMAECMVCHADEAPQYNACASCHTVRTSALSSELIFDHGAHVNNNKDCSRCHGDVPGSEAIPASEALKMAQCMNCHADEAPQHNECATCHRDIRQDRAPPSHRLGWREKHGRLPMMEFFSDLPQDCSMCHTRSSCDECHRAEMPRNHTNLFRLHGHAAMASMDRDRCTVCHTTDSCVACHGNMLPRSHKRGGFTSPFNRHCVSCHLPLERGPDEGCGVCHRSARHETAPMRPPNAAHMTTNSEACRECHMPPPHLDNGQSCLACHR